MPKPQTVTLTIAPQDVAKLLNALQLLPWGEVDPLIRTIIAQNNAQALKAQQPKKPKPEKEGST